MVLDAENLVRDDILQKTRRKSGDISITLKSSFHKVDNWLLTQSQSVPPLVPILTTDGEASCEYTESDSAAHDTDGSEGLADSVATCLPGGVGSNSQCTSTEVISGSTDQLKENSDNNCPTAKRRTKRRNSDRPHSVSCLAQLIQKKPVNRSSENVHNQGFTNHSISLDTLNTTVPQMLHMKNSDSKSSLKRKRMLLKKKQRSDSGSNGSDGSSVNRSSSNNSLIKSESFSGRINLQEKQMLHASVNVQTEVESEENVQLVKPKFQLGAYTTNVFGNSHLGALAPLAFYNSTQVKSPNVTVRESSYTGTEDNSNLSEQQVWDDFQEYKEEEAYSEGLDSDAARKLLDDDDYRKYFDSQSDCCSSLSAANNLDSMSPPRYRKQFGTPLLIGGNKSSSKSPSDDDNTMRRRRALFELEIERKRRNQTENNRKGSLEGM